MWNEATKPFHTLCEATHVAYVMVWALKFFLRALSSWFSDRYHCFSHGTLADDSLPGSTSPQNLSYSFKCSVAALTSMSNAHLVPQRATADRAGFPTILNVFIHHKADSTTQIERVHKSGWRNPTWRKKRKWRKKSHDGGERERGERSNLPPHLLCFFTPHFLPTQPQSSKRCRPSSPPSSLHPL